MEGSLKFRFQTALPEQGIRKEKFCNLIKCYSISMCLCYERTRYTPRLHKPCEINRKWESLGRRQKCQYSVGSRPRFDSVNMVEDDTRPFLKEWTMKNKLLRTEKHKISHYHSLNHEDCQGQKEYRRHLCCCNKTRKLQGKSSKHFLCRQVKSGSTGCHGYKVHLL